MADGGSGLIFPVKFDLQKAVNDAGGDIDKVVRKMEVMIKSRPLTIRPKIDDAGLRDLSNRLANLSTPSVSIGSGDNAFIAQKGSINALNDAMQKCINEWNQLAESERIVNRENGEYTTKAQQIIERFSELTAASNTFAKTLQQVARESKTATDAEIKRNQKAAEQVAIMSSQGRTLDQVNSKTKLLTNLMGGLDKSSTHWRVLASDLERVKQFQSELQAVQKAELAQMQSEYTSVKQLVSALQNYGGTIGQIQVKLSAFKSALNNTTVGSAAFRVAALQIKAMNKELQRANQLVQNYQAKSLQGVRKKNSDVVVLQMEQYQQRIQQIDTQMNRAHAKGQDMGSQQMIKLLQERIVLEEKLKNLMTTGADLAKQKLDAEIAAQQKLIEETAKRADAYNKKRQQEAEDLAAQQKKAVEEARIKQESIAKERQANEARKRILKEQIVSYDTLTQKIQMLETARNKTDIGTKRWARLTTEINKARESLKIITDEMDKATKRSERIARLREILATSTQSMAGLNARLQEANAQLQKVDSGTATFDRLALKVARLSEEYQKVQQYAQDFAQKAFQGLSAGDTSKRVAELQHWRQQLQQVEEEYNRLRNYTLQNGSTTAIDKQINALLSQRKNITKQIAQATMTAEQQQAEREKEINRIIDARNAKQRKHNEEVRKAVQARKEERTMLNAHERSIDNISKKLQHWQTKLNSTDMKSADFTRIAKEVERLTGKLEEARHKMAEMTGQSTQLKNATAEFSKQETYLSRLIKRMAVYASISSIGNFLTKIREVTAQFELQKISLGAILQDQNRANVLFSEIKAFALKSPVSILDLTKYTKQLAAYKIGYEDLFETTKRLTDISVGLGVSMDRIILMYGQIRATGYLRASEVRQATEAGIPLVEELAKKLSIAKDEMVSAADVMDMISKRQISFGLVKQVFEDMTNSGGIFYNMQEKQGNTLFGMWAKLGDATSVMFEQIGNTSAINNEMKSLIRLMTDAMKHWTAFAGILQTTIIGFGAYKVAMAGLIPFYDLQLKHTINQAKAEKAKQAQQIKTLAIGRQLSKEEQLIVANKNKLTKAEWEQLLTEKKLSAAQKLTLGRQAATNIELQRAVTGIKMFTKAQVTALGNMSKWSFFWAKFKSQIQSVGQMFVNLGRTMLSFAPLVAITAIADLVTGLAQSLTAQSEAVKKVDEKYKETKTTLMQIENAYRDIQKATKLAGESEEEFAKTSYSQKLEQLQKIINLLDQFGMKNVIDPSVLDYTNIDPVLDKWLEKLNEVNELSKSWGREVALVANAFEGPFSIFGENLKEDMKDLERAWSKLTVNTKFNTSLEQLRAIVGKLSNDNKQVYDKISLAIGVDLKLALAQKKRNESELQYQQRIFKNYKEIESWIATFRKEGKYKGVLPTLSSGEVQDMLSSFQSQVDEVMHEFDKTKEKFRGQDALTVKMAIDTVATEHDWADWQRELLIQHLNENPITLNAEIIPTTNSAGQGAVAEGLKAIIASEFPTLFDEHELASLASIDNIIEALNGKLDASTETLKKVSQLQNNITYGSMGYETSLKSVAQLHNEIIEVEKMRKELAELLAVDEGKTSAQLLRQSELQAKLADVDEASLNTKRAQAAAIMQANEKYDEQIKKQRESVEEERKLAQAALNRVASMGLSDLGKDVKAQFGDLMVDSFKEITDNNYSTKFLISDEEIKNTRDMGDLYDMWAKNIKTIAEERKKIAGTGISGLTVEQERAKLEQKRAKTQSDLLEIEKELNSKKFKQQNGEYNLLKFNLANATTASAQSKAQKELNDFLGKTENKEYAILQMKQKGLKTELQRVFLAETVNQNNAEYLKRLGGIETLWKELGERYNFKLQEPVGDGGRGEDPWILLMKNRMKFMQDFQKGVENLSKWMGRTNGLAEEQGNMLGRGLSLKIDSRQLNGTEEELVKWYEDSIEEIRKRIAKLGGKEWEGLGVQMILAKDTRKRVLKKYQELLADMFKGLTDFRTEQAQKAIEDKIKQLADEISRTKVAKEFYGKILATTGDHSLASKVAESIFGQNGSMLQKALADQVRGMTNKIELPEGIISADNIIDYKALRRFAEANKDELGKMYDELVKISEQGQKDLAKTYEGYLKDLEKAKTYSDKRIELARYTANQIAEIEKSTLPKSEKERLTAGYREREDKEAAKLEYEAFKETPMYVQMFEDLDNASTTMLRNMRDMLNQLKGKWGETLEPTQLKEMQSRLNAISEQLAKRNPFKAIGEGIGKIRTLNKEYGSLKNVEKELATATKQLLDNKDALTAALQAEAVARAEYDKVVAESGVDSAAVKNAKGSLDSVTALVNRMRKNVNLTEQEVKLLQEIIDKFKDANDEVDDGFKGIGEYVAKVKEAQDAIKGAAEEWTALGDDELWNTIFDGLDKMALSAEQGGEAVAAYFQGDYFTMVTKGISAVANLAAGIGKLFWGSKVAKANKEIKRQQESLEQLEYAYGRLEKAADKVFGRDYLNNYNRQLKNLQAQQAAYLKQAEAERSKGKKKDKDKIKEYEDQARETADEIKDMQDELIEHFTGSSRTDWARKLAQSWIDARASMSDTFAAIKEDYKEMIKTMVVEGAAARIIENAMNPMLDAMSNKLKDSDIEGATDVISNGMNKVLAEADNGMEILWKSLEAHGYNMKELVGDAESQYSGIAKNISGATSEEINNVATIGNTLMYYVSPIPRIDENLAKIVALIENGGAVSGATSASSGWTDWQQQAMENYIAIQRNTADTVVECRRAADACESITKLIKTKGATSGLNVFLNS